MSKNKARLAVVVLVAIIIIVLLFLRSRQEPEARKDAKQRGKTTAAETGGAGAGGPTKEHLDPDIVAAEHAAGLDVYEDEMTPSFRKYRASLIVAGQPMRTTYEFDYGDGTHESSVSGQVEHAFHGPETADVPVARFTVKISAKDDAGKVYTAQRSVEFNNTIGVLRAIGQVPMDAGPCIVMFSPTNDNWRCRFIVFNPNDETFVPKDTMASLNRGTSPSVMIKATPLLRESSARIDAGKTGEITVTLPKDAMLKGTVGVTFTTSGIMEQSGKRTSIVTSGSLYLNAESPELK